MKFKIKEVSERIFSAQFTTQYDVASTFMRLQEFYESPFKELRNKYFSLEQCMDRYAKKFGNFSYTSDWAGFNVPSKVVQAFIKAFEHDFLEKEEDLICYIETHIFFEKEFYLIGHSEKENSKVTEKNIYSILAHEVAHGKYYLDKNYNKLVSKLLHDMNPQIKKIMTEELLNFGYTKGVINDEIQAYLATSEPEYIKEKFKIKKKDFPHQFNKLFREFI